MRLFPLVAATLTLPACLDSDPSPADDLQQPPDVTFVTGTGCTDGYNCDHPAIAVGGTDHFFLPNGLPSAATVTGQFAYDGHGTVRAGAEDVGSLISLDHRWQMALVASPLATVALQPRASDPAHDLVLETPGSFVLPATATDVIVRLEDATHLRLVDTTTTLTQDADRELGHPRWDVIALPKVAGTYHVVVSAGSFGPRAFDVDVVDHVERISMLGPATLAAGEGATVCFHAYTGTGEVAIGETLSISGPAMFLGAQSPNCVTYTTTGQGMVHLTAAPIDGSAPATFDVTVQ